MKLDNLSWIPWKRSDAMLYFSPLDISKESDAIMIVMSSKDLSMWEIWYYDESKMKLHKLNSIWEGPFIISKVTRPGSYSITDADGNEVTNS